MVAIVVTPTPSFADVCDVKEHIFWTDEPGSSFRLNAYGSSNDIRFVYRDLNQSCSDAKSDAWSTSHIRLGGVTGDWVEVGWKVLVDRGTFWFSEAAIGFLPAGGNQGVYPCDDVTGLFARWRVTNVLGTNTWNLRVNCLGNPGSADILLHSIGGMGTDHGYPVAEVGRRGGVTTGMSDRQRNLQWKNSTGVWNNWVDPSCGSDDASNWEGRQDSPTEYHTIRDDANPTNCNW